MPDSPAEVFIRPENVHVGGPVAAMVQESTFLGSMPRTLLRTEDGALIRLQRPARERLEFGERVDEGFDAVPVAVRPAG